MARLNISELRERCHALPQKLVLELFGFRQWIELQRFADKWRLPIGGKTCDLFALFRELRSFASKYGAVLSALIEDLPTDGSEGELGVRYLRAKIAKTEADAAMAELRVQQKAGTLCFADDVHQIFNAIIDRFHKGCDHAQAKWGHDGADFFEQLAAGIKTDILAVIGSNAEANDDQSGEAAGEAKVADDA